MASSASPSSAPSLISSSLSSFCRLPLFSPTATLPPQIFHGQTQSLRQSQGRNLKRQFIRATALDGPPVVNEADPNLVAALKFKLLSVVSGLNRGLAASEDDLRKAETAAKELEDLGGVIDLTNSENLDKLQGRWKLIYSSAFSSRTLGGSRPGPPTGRLLPITLGQVYQRIDVLSKDFDNIVELQLGTPWPIPPAEAVATLAHKFEIIGTSNIKITFEKTTVKPTGSLAQLPPLDIPRLPDVLRPASNTGSGEFEVTYLDLDLRITRGDRGELRVFVIS